MTRSRDGFEPWSQSSSMNHRVPGCLLLVSLSLAACQGAAGGTSSTTSGPAAAAASSGSTGVGIANTSSGAAGSATGSTGESSSGTSGTSGGGGGSSSTGGPLTGSVTTLVSGDPTTCEVGDAGPFGISAIALTSDGIFVAGGNLD